MLHSSEVEIVKVSAASAAGQTTVESTFVDCGDYAGVMFIVCASSVASGGSATVLAQQAPQSDGTGKADLDSTSHTVTDADDGDVYVVDVRNPSDRYVGLKLTRADADSVFGEIYAIKYGPSKKPISQPAATNVLAENTPSE